MCSLVSAIFFAYATNSLSSTELDALMDVTELSLLSHELFALSCVMIVMSGDTHSMYLLILV